MPGHLFYVEYMEANLVNLSFFMFSLNQIKCDCDISLNVYLKASVISYCYCTMATNIRLIIDWICVIYSVLYYTFLG